MKEAILNIINSEAPYHRIESFMKIVKVIKSCAFSKCDMTNKEKQLLNAEKMIKIYEKRYKCKEKYLHNLHKVMKGMLMVQETI